MYTITLETFRRWFWALGPDEATEQAVKVGVPMPVIVEWLNAI